MGRIPHAIIGLLVFVAGAVPAQPRAVPARASQAPPVMVDTLDAVEAGIREQRVFERVRLNHMPYGPGAFSSERCKEVIGRFCYTYGDRSGKSDPPPKEHTDVERAREKLIVKFDSLTRAAPPSGWLTGTLVRYFMEAGEPDSARLALRNCRAAAWWCAALRGFVNHASARHVDAEREFSAARTLMDSTTRCNWDDIGELLSTADQRAYDALPCRERLSLSQKAWWLGQPLFSREGNDRRSEHDVRQVLSMLSETGINPTWLRWGDDMEEIVVRLGWPAYWRRYWGTMGMENSLSPRVSQYNLEPSFHFLPSLSAMRNPSGASDADWILLPEYSYEEYSPGELVFAPLSHQSARLLRGDSILLVSRFDAGKSASASDSLVAAIAISREPGDTPVVCRFPMRPDRTTRVCRVQRGPAVASIEVTSEDSLARVERARFGVADIRISPRGHALSDIIFLEGEPPETPSLDAAMNRMCHTLRLPAEQITSLFWEVYGIRANDRIDLEITAIPEERGFFRKVGEALRLVSRTGAVQVSWHEVAQTDAQVHAGSVALALSRLRAGNHTVMLRVSINSGQPLTAERRVEILR